MARITDQRPDFLTYVEDIGLIPGANVQVVSNDAFADAITLHCPLVPETYHLVDTRRLDLAKPGLVLVNTSRGGLIDIDALEAALEDGRVSAAGLDVLEDEPDPDLSRPILQRDNVFVTGHVAWYSLEAKRELALFSADEALRVLDGGRPRNAVNPTARD